jgi:hypothetical protein
MRTINPGALPGAAGAREHVLAAEFDGSLHPSNEPNRQSALFVFGGRAA